MNMKDLVNTWTLPSISNERVQVTLRIQFDDYARLHALKEAYPRRSVNDILSDIIRLGLDEIIAALPSHVVSEEEAEYFPERDVGRVVGPLVDFQYAYRRILEEKSVEEKKQKEITS